MADLKISALNSLAGADLVAADVVAVVDDSASETKKLTVSDLIANGTTLISDATIPSAKILFSAGSVATASVADAGITTAKVADSSITAAKLADNSSVTLVSTLPASGDFTGQIALDTDDDKIYIWDGSAWDSVKGAGSINVVNGSTTGEVNIVTSTSGDTVTVSATLDDTTAAAQFLAGPTGAGGTVGYRAIIGTDLPTASTTAKGGVIVNGNGLTMSSDTIAIDNTVTAETEENHIVQYDANGLITGGRAIVAADVPNATSTAAGIIKPGSGLGVTGAGELNHNNSVTAGTASKVTFDAQGHITGTESLVAADIPDLDADKITTGSVPTARIAADAVTAEKLADRSTATIAETTPAGGAFIGQTHLNSITGDYFLWDGNVWQPIGISVGEIVLAGTYDASTNLVATVTAEGTAVGFTVGSALPAASSSNKSHYVIVSEAGTGTSPAPTIALNPPDFLLSTGTAYTEIDVSDTVTAQQASNIQFTAAGSIAATNVQSAIEELDTEKVASASPTFTGTVSLGEDAVITFEGATDNAFETTLSVVDPTADRTLSLPDVTGTLVSTGDTGTVTSTMITDGTIVNADINASAEIAVSKLANGTARQLLQTDVAGSGVEFTSNIDVPGTLDVTGAATLDSTLTVTGVISADGKVKFPAGTASAPSFYSGTDTNTGLYFSNADEISVATAGTQRVVVDASGEVGIGVASPQTGLHISDGSSLAAPQTTGAGRLTVQNSSSADIQLMSANTGYNHIFFGDQDDANVGVIYYQHNSGVNAMVFTTNAAERLRIDSSGNVLVGKTASSGLTAGCEFRPAGMGLFTRASGNPVQVRRLTDDGDLVEFYQDSSLIGSIGVSGSSLTVGMAGPEKLRVDSSGRLLVGTNTSSGYSSARLIINGAGSDATASGNLVLQRGEANGSISNGDQIGTINFGDESGYSYATIVANAALAPGSDSPGNLLFSTTADGASSSTERMRITSAGHVDIGANNGSSSGEGFYLQRDGGGYIFTQSALDAVNIYQGDTKNVEINSSGSAYFASNFGIGTTSPGTRLHVNGTTPTMRVSNGTTQIVELKADSSASILRTTTNHPLLFGTNDTERMRIDSSGRLLLGTTTEGEANADDFTVATSGNTGITVRSGTTNKGNIYFSDGTSGDAEYRGIIEYNHDGDTLKLGTANYVRATIDSSGKVGIGTSSPDQLLTVNGGVGINNGGGSGGAPILTITNASGSPLVNATSNATALTFGYNSTERMRLDSSGRLLVGTTSSVGDSFLQIQGDAANSLNGGSLLLRRGEHDGHITAGEALGQISFSDNGGEIFSTIKCEADAAAGTNDHPGRLVFSITADSASSPTERMRIDSSGQILFGATGTSAPSYFFAPDSGGGTFVKDTNSTSSRTAFIFRINGTEVGSIKTSSSSTSYNTSSDYRLKENVVDIADGITRVKQLQPKRFNFIADAETTVDGFLAHEAQTVVPEAVTGTHNEVDGDGNAVMQGIDQSKLVPLLTAALQEAIAKIETLEAKVAALEAG